MSDAVFSTLHVVLTILWVVTVIYVIGWYW